MSTPRSLRTQTRARYARAGNADLMVNDPDGFPSEFPPIWWMGLDSGGLSYPIGPHGPFTHGYGAGLPVVTRATSLITGPLTAVPFRVLELGFGGQPLPRPRWITDPMLRRPEDTPQDIWPEVLKLPRSVFWRSWIASAIWWGVGAFLTRLDADGQPLAGSMLNVDSRLLSTEKDSQGVLRWVLGADAGDERAVFDRHGLIRFDGVTYRLVTLRNPHSAVDVEGHSAGVFEQCPEAFGLARQIDTYASGTFRSGIPAGYLKVDQSMNSMTQEQADALKAKWMASHGGDRRSIAVLNAFTSFVPLNLSPVDAALGEVKRLNIADVAYSFGLSPETLGVTLTNSATYQNLREAWLNHKDFGLAPWIAAVEDTLTALLSGSRGVKVNLDGFANPPLKERVETGKLAVEAGLITVDEWRETEGLPPLPEPVPVAVVEAPPAPVELEEARERRPSWLHR
jgi:phage portal protein BeeE